VDGGMVMLSPRKVTNVCEEIKWPGKLR